jgi:TRAP-type mannitol/chloroaromatic compound transport system substrate-binding protein
MTTGRRAFLATATALAAAAVEVPSVIAQPRVEWRMSTAWTPAFDILQGAARRLASIVHEMSGGRFRIDVFPAGQIMPAFECFDAASQGKIDAFMGSPQYWSDKEPAIEWFCTIPFGMNPQGMAAWYAQGDGLKLWEETYAAFNLVPRPAMGNAPQMAGWFRNKITAIGDFKGLKMRVPNLGGKVYARAGATTVLTPLGEVYAALERGVIDAAELIGPHDDVKVGLHRTARHYYYPGWHEPGTTLDFGFNKKAYEALPTDLRRTLDHATAAVHVYGSNDFHTKHATALKRLRTEFKGKVEIVQFPVPVLRDLKKLALDVMSEEAERSPMARKVHESYVRFQSLVGPWDHVAEGAYHRLVAG